MAADRRRQADAIDAMPAWAAARLSAALKDGHNVEAALGRLPLLAANYCCHRSHASTSHSAIPIMAVQRDWDAI